MKLIVLFITCVFGKNEFYRGWKSYNVIPETEQQLTSLVNRTKYLQDIDILSHPQVNREGLFLVKPSDQVNFIEFLKEFNINYKIHAADVKKALDHDLKLIRRKREVNNLSNHKPYNSYMELDLIYKYLDDIANTYKNVKLIEPALSFEGRKIKYLKISTTNFNDTTKPIIFIDGGIHAREWITSPVVTWAVHKLVVNVTEQDLLDRFDWILFPIVNPDGYEYSFSSNRFWRKTRSMDPHNELCSGVNANKNFDFFWNTVGTSFSPCDETYAGITAFSEIETRVVRDILLENVKRMAMYITVHSYGSMILYPWGHDGSPSKNLQSLRAVGEAMANAIHDNQLPFFPRYMVGNSALVLFYGSAGSSDDYAHMIGVPLSFNIELPGLSNGLKGFHLEEQYIEQVCRETWEGFVAGARLASVQLNLTLHN